MDYTHQTLILPLVEWLRLYKYVILLLVEPVLKHETHIVFRKNNPKSAILPLNRWCLSKKTRFHNKCRGANKTKAAVRDVRDDC